MKKILIFIILIAVIGLTGCKKDIHNEDILENIYVTNSKNEIESLYEKSNSKSIWDYFDDFINGGAKDMVAEADAMPTEADSEYGETSTTNLVVEGVDEAATIKNDNRFIYTTLSSSQYYFSENYRNILLVIDTLDDSCYKYDLEATILGLYLKEDLIVLCRKDYTTIKVVRFDITNPKELKVKDNFVLDGAYYLDSRMIDNKLYLFSHKVIIEDGKYTNPSYQINDGVKEIDLSDININKDASHYGNTMTLIQEINFDNGNIYSKGFYGLSPSFYVSLNNIYLYITHYNEIESNYNSNCFTRVIRMKKNNLEIAGEIFQPGVPNNIYSLNEGSNETFRMVTTYSEVEDYYKYHNHIAQYYIDGNRFELASSYEFALGEKIYSANFQDDKAYVVTYLYIDPLFEFDLSQKDEIKVERSLKSPGVSDYLDYINDDFILGIGRMTEEHEAEDHQYATGGIVKLSLFSLDNEEMVEEDTFVTNYSYSYADIFSDHTKLVKLSNSLTYYFGITGQKQEGYDYGSEVVGFKIDLENRKIIYLGSVVVDNYDYKYVVVNSKLYVIDTSVKVAGTNQEINNVKVIG